MIVAHCEKFSVETRSNQVQRNPHLFFEPVVILHDSGHHHVCPFHVQSNLPSRHFLSEARKERVRVRDFGDSGFPRLHLHFSAP